MAISYLGRNPRFFFFCSSLKHLYFQNFLKCKHCNLFSWYLLTYKGKVFIVLTFEGVCSKRFQNIFQVFHNCTCVEEAGLQKSNFSASLGECPRGADCTRKYHIYLAMQVLTGFSVACSGPSFILLVVRWVQLLKDFPIDCTANRPCGVFP